MLIYCTDIGHFPLTCHFFDTHWGTSLETTYGKNEPRKPSCGNILNIQKLPIYYINLALLILKCKWQNLIAFTKVWRFHKKTLTLKKLIKSLMFSSIFRIWFRNNSISFVLFHISTKISLWIRPSHDFTQANVKISIMLDFFFSSFTIFTTQIQICELKTILCGIPEEVFSIK